MNNWSGLWWIAKVSDAYFQLSSRYLQALNSETDDVYTKFLHNLFNRLFMCYFTNDNYIIGKYI